MKKCTKCGGDMYDDAVLCPHCHYTTEDAPAATYSYQLDNISVGFCILSALCPLFGWIYWGSVHSDRPKRARACGIVAIISFVISFIIATANMEIIVTYI